MFRRVVHPQCRSKDTKRLPRGQFAWSRLASMYVPTQRTKRKPPPSAAGAPPRIAWPMNLLEDAYKTKLIPLSSSRATDFLTEFVRLARTGTPSPSAIQPLLKRTCVWTKPLDDIDWWTGFEIDSRTLFWLGWVLQKASSPDGNIGPAAKLLQTTSARLRDEYASLILVESALRANRPDHQDIGEAVDTLIDMSNRGNAFATERLAVLRELQDKRNEALSLAEEAIKAEYTGSAVQGSVLDPRFSAWKTVARLRSRANNPTSPPTDAIEYGAKVLDDPDAYFDLAEESNDPESKQTLEYFLKAAASGDARAALKVANWYFKRTNDDLLKTKKSEFSNPGHEKMPSDNFHLALATEWYELALKSPKHNLDAIKEAAGRGVAATLLAPKDEQRRKDLAAEYAEMKWARNLLSKPTKPT